MNIGDHRLYQLLTRELGIAIVSGKIVSDQGYLSEASMCTNYAISRTTVREALKMLSAKGLIESVQRKGIRIKPVEDWNYFDSELLEWILATPVSSALAQDFYQLRLAIEPAAAAICATNPTASFRFRLEKAYAKITPCTFSSDCGLTSSEEFHREILHTTGNRFYSRLSNFVSTAIKIAAKQVNPSSVEYRWDQEAYKELYNAIRNKNSGQAKSQMRKLLEQQHQQTILNLTSAMACVDDDEQTGQSTKLIASL